MSLQTIVKTYIHLLVIHYFREKEKELKQKGEIERYFFQIYLRDSMKKKLLIQNILSSEAILLQKEKEKETHVICEELMTAVPVLFLPLHAEEKRGAGLLTPDLS